MPVRGQHPRVTRLTPVAVFGYKRPEHLRQVLNSLRANAEASRTEVHLFLDGPKTAQEEQLVDEVRRVARAAHGFGSIHLVERERNLGLSGSIVDGVGKLCDEFGAAVVLEDDVAVSPFFLDYVNRALTKYREDERVVSVGCYMFPVSQPLPESFFLRITDCWGWAVWKRSWDLYEPDGVKLLREIESRRLVHEFDFEGTYPYTRMLANQVAGKNDSWAVRWYAQAFLRNGLTLYPGRSVTHNIGMDATGTHAGAVRHYDVELAASPIELADIDVVEDESARRAVGDFFRSTYGKRTVRSRLRSWVAGPARLFGSRPSTKV
jgi:hypothetical protein